MATYNDGLGYNLNSPGAGYPAHTNWREAILEVVLNISEIAAARAEANLPALADGDTLEIHSLPEQCAVLAAGLAVEEVSTGALTVSVGDGSSVDQFIAASLVNADTSYAGLTGNYYPAADVLTVTLVGVVPVDGIIRVWAKVVDGAGQVAVSSIPGATPPNP